MKISPLARLIKILPFFIFGFLCLPDCSPLLASLMVEAIKKLLQTIYKAKFSLLNKKHSDKKHDAYFIDVTFYFIC